MSATYQYFQIEREMELERKKEERARERERENGKVNNVNLGEVHGVFIVLFFHLL